MKDRIDPDALYDIYFEADGAPTKADRDPQTLQALRAKALAEKEQMKKMAMAQEAAKSYKDVTKAPEKGSPGDQATQQGGGR
jgi:hypothetical protein